MRDMVRKQRHATATNPGIRSGEKNPRSKLSKAQVAEIRSLYSTGMHTQVELAQVFGVRQNQISRIIRNELWKVS